MSDRVPLQVSVGGIWCTPWWVFCQQIADGEILVCNEFRQTIRDLMLAGF